MITKSWTEMRQMQPARGRAIRADDVDVLQRPGPLLGHWQSRHGKGGDRARRGSPPQVGVGAESDTVKVVANRVQVKHELLHESEALGKDPVPEEEAKGMLPGSLAGERHGHGRRGSRRHGSNSRVAVVTGTQRGRITVAVTRAEEGIVKALAEIVLLPRAVARADKGDGVVRHRKATRRRHRTARNKITKVEAMKHTKVRKPRHSARGLLRERDDERDPGGTVALRDEVQEEARELLEVLEGHRKHGRGEGGRLATRQPGIAGLGKGRG